MFKFKFRPHRTSDNGAFQLKFSGLTVKNGKFTNVKKFVFAMSGYFLSKVGLFGVLSARLPLALFNLGQKAKDYIVIKLIWSRGKLGRPIANFAILMVALVVFLTGGVFSSTTFVTSAQVSPDFLANADDVIPESTVATTSLPEGRRNEAIIHEVRGGETLSSIGELYKVTSDALEYVNNITDADYLKVGQKIVIPPVQGVLYKVKSGDTCSSIAKKFDVASQAILDFNYLDSCTTLEIGKELVIPDATIPAPVQVFPTPGGPVSYERYVDNNPKHGWCQWPTTARIITQYFSYYHNGADIATPWGTYPPIYACSGGTVIRAGWDPWGLGLHVIIDHGNGYETTYGHMNKINVSVGQDVDKGDVIGIMGSTGRSTGPHVHFIVKYKGTAQNPFNYIK